MIWDLYFEKHSYQHFHHGSIYYKYHGWGQGHPGPTTYGRTARDALYKNGMVHGFSLPAMSLEPQLVETLADPVPEGWAPLFRNHFASKLKLHASPILTMPLHALAKLPNVFVYTLHKPHGSTNFLCILDDFLGFPWKRVLNQARARIGKRSCEVWNRTLSPQNGSYTRVLISFTILSCSVPGFCNFQWLDKIAET